MLTYFNLINNFNLFQSYTWNVRGTLNGDFIGASDTTASVDGVADVNGTAGEGAPFNHSSWIWGGFGHYGLGFMKGKFFRQVLLSNHFQYHFYKEQFSKTQ